MKKKKQTKNKKKIIIISVVVVIVALIAGLVIKTLLETDNEPIYGNRLEGIGEYKISSENIDNLKKDISELDLVESVDYELEGKLINVIIVVDDTLELATFDSYGKKVLEYFTDEQKSYYDIQIFGSSNNEDSENYPVIGYKKNTSESITW